MGGINQKLRNSAIQSSFRRATALSRPPAFAGRHRCQWPVRDSAARPGRDPHHHI